MGEGKEESSSQETDNAHLELAQLIDHVVHSLWQQWKEAAVITRCQCVNRQVE